MGGPANHWFGVALTGVTLATAGAARAGTGGCEDPRIRVAGDLSPGWREAIERACAELAALPSTDPSARVRIVPIDQDVLIDVTLADGRFASRHLQSPDALRSTLEALLMVPPPRTRPNAVDAGKEAAPSTETTWPRTEAPEPAPAPAGSSVGIELGAGLGGRVAARGYLSVIFGAFAEMRLGPWLFGTVLRWDFLGQKDAPRVDTFELETVGAGLLVGRRIPLPFGSLDTGVTPRLAVETQSYENKTGEQSVSTTDVRVGAFGRLAFGKAALRAVVEIDAELSPSRLRRTVQLDPLLPPLPAWSAGLSAGLMWAAP